MANQTFIAQTRDVSFADRYQCVRINEVYGNILQVKCRVPQGAVWGTLLYIIFANNLAGYLLSLSCYRYSLLCRLYQRTNIRWECVFLGEGVSDIYKSVVDWVSNNKFVLNVGNISIISCTLNRINQFCFQLYNNDNITVSKVVRYSRLEWQVRMFT